jgi:glycosyltransferase involved in cell wall biosynthesis
VTETLELVSTVIPTRNRSGLIARAVQSALNQTFRSIEVIVVVDGPDEKTVQTLSLIEDSRLCVVSLQESVGAPEARNVGVRRAHGHWVAFLDDDDEWLPTKLERQIEAARASRWKDPLVSCRLVAKMPEGDVISPRREPVPGESVPEYLFLRNLSELSEIRLQTSTLMATKELVMRVPWRKCAHDEWDLLLRASAIEGVGLAFTLEPLVIWHSDAGLARLSRAKWSWRRSADWFRSMRSLVGPRVYAGFLLSTLSIWARNEGDWSAFFELPFEAIRLGQPTIPRLLIHVARWLMPRRMRRSLKTILARS